MAMGAKLTEIERALACAFEISVFCGGAALAPSEEGAGFLPLWGKKTEGEIT